MVEKYLHPGGFHTIEQIEDTRSEILAGNSTYTIAYNQVLDIANEGLNHISSVATTAMRISGFYKYPEEHNEAKNKISKDSVVAYTCALVYALNVNLSKDERDKYANKSKEILNNWGYNNKTITGRDGPLLMAYTAIAMIYAAELIYDTFSNNDLNQFKLWVTKVLYSKISSIKHNKNNWGCWSVLTSLAIDHLVDDTVKMNADFIRLCKIINKQIATNGTLPKEILRIRKSIRYTAFALEAITAAVEIIRNVKGINLYIWKAPRGGILKNALEYYYTNGIIDKSKWEIKNSETHERRELMEAMSYVYGIPEWRSWYTGPVCGIDTGLGWIFPTLMRPRRIVCNYPEINPKRMINVSRTRYLSRS